MRDHDRHGNLRHYFRRTGEKKIRLPGHPGSAEFLAAYDQALKHGRAVATEHKDPASFAALLISFYRSQEYKRLNLRSRRVRRMILDKFSAKHGSKPFAKLERRHVLAFRDELADKPGAATNLIKALRSVFNYALEYDLVKVNPAAQVDYLKTGGSGFHSWTIDEVRQFEARHPIGTQARLAMALLLYTGQRRSDVVLFGKHMVRDGRLHYAQQKTGKRMATRIIRPLQDIIDATPSKGSTFLETGWGKSFTANGFGNAFREWCDEAGLKHCTSHGLRKALAARLAELGATVHQIKDLLGHSALAMAALYTKGADQMINSDAALELFENIIVPPTGQVGQKGLKRPGKSAKFSKDGGR
ncbi:MAG: tyrosine-type recombinase/integrase [Alphaproteobacteria bacterium]|nr:tyrosine-type recombinase/integrase [Alphaproteobacteria bacterium]